MFSKQDIEIEKDISILYMRIDSIKRLHIIDLILVLCYMEVALFVNVSCQLQQNIETVELLLLTTNNYFTSLLASSWYMMLVKSDHIATYQITLLDYGKKSRWDE